MEQPNFHPHCRDVGVKYWVCPNCGHMQRTVVRATTWKLKCSSPECRRSYAFGTVFYAFPKHAGHRLLPPIDTVFPEVAWGGKWASGEPVHRVVSLADDSSDRTHCKAHRSQSIPGSVKPSYLISHKTTRTPV